MSTLRVLRGILAVAVPAALFAWHACMYGRWEVDDAGITFAYARSVATGAGPVLQPGLPPVEGFSDPAWLGLLVLGRWLGLFDHGTWFGVPDYVAYPKTLALLLITVTFGLFLAIASAVSRFPATVTVVAGCVCAAIPSLVIWSVSGLENALLVAAVVGIGAVLVRARDRLGTWRPAVACGLLAALAALTRPEGAIYAAAYPLALLLAPTLPRAPWSSRPTGRTAADPGPEPPAESRAAASSGTRSAVGAGATRTGPGAAGPVRTISPVVVAGRWVAMAALSTVAFAVPMGAYLAWRLATFHAWVPTTAIAKSQGLPTAAGFAKVSQLVTYAGWVAALVAAVLVGAGLARRTPGVARLLVPLALALVAFGVLIPDWMEQYRFASPVWALTPLVAALAAADIVPALAWRGRAVAGLLAVGAVVTSGPGFVTDVRTFAAAPTAPLCLIVTNTGREFNGYLDVLGLASGTFFAPEIGGGALTGRALLTDGGGLAEPTVARFWAAKDPAGIRDYVLDVVKPTFVRAHGQFRPFIGLDADPRFRRDYVEIGPTPNNGANWVRRDLVPDAATLTRLQAWARLANAADSVQRETPRASCGDRLLVGPTTA